MGADTPATPAPQDLRAIVEKVGEPERCKVTQAGPDWAGRQTTKACAALRTK